MEVFNKFDLIDFSVERIRRSDHSGQKIFVSAKTGFGLQSLRSAIYEKSLAETSIGSSHGVTITNLRHLNSLEESMCFIEKAIEGIGNSVGGEVVAADLRSATNKLGMIIGSVTSGDVLDHIFSKFCIGK